MRVNWPIYGYRLIDNAELLKRRLKSLEDSREQLDCSLKEQIAYNRTLEREMHKLKPELLQLVRQRDKHLMYVYRNFLLYVRLKLQSNIFFFFTIMLQMAEKERYETK